MKIKYYPPVFVEFEFYVEESICVGSTRLTFGGENPNDNVPTIMDDYELTDAFGWETEIF